MKYTFSIIFLNLFFIAASYSQPLPLIEQIQSEISTLVNQAKHSIVTVSSKSTHAYTVDKTSGLKSFLLDEKEKKKDNIWIVGSGIIYNKDGFIITKGSMLANFEEIKVTLYNKNDYAAKYIGTDVQTGLAILKINAENLKPVKLGNSDEVSVYSMGMVLGNSMGISPFASFGIVNGITDQGLFIISAPINPGSSGAGIFNLKGELIGIISAQLESDVWMNGPSFMDYSNQNGVALASNRVRNIIDQIIRMHHEQRGWLGIKIIPDSLERGKIVVDSVISGSPAQQCGLKQGDWLLKYNENYVSSLKKFADQVEQTKPGTTVSIDFIRDERVLKVFPQIAHKQPANFNPHKPRDNFTSAMKNINEDQVPFEPQVIISPERLNQINRQILEMEKEIQFLKKKLKQSHLNN